MQHDILLHHNPSFNGMAMAMSDIPFFCEGQQQLLTLVTPAWDKNGEETPRFPAVVFLQGSAWTSPNRFFQLPQLCAYAQQGIAVASITHRDATEGNPFPAYLKDAKAAIRFLRAEADTLGLNPDRVGFFGTSSGGNTALLVGLTGDDPRYKTADYESYSDAVRLVVDCFGPADLMMIPEQEVAANERIMGIMHSLIGEGDMQTVLKAMSPVYEVKNGQTYPPFLILQGDRDQDVPYAQSEKMHARLKEAGADSTLVLVQGAGHEGSFWSGELHALILDFIKKHI